MLSNDINIKLAIAIPTYNEAKNVRALTSSIKKYAIKNNTPCTVLFIDDDSLDGTGKIIDKLIKTKQSELFNVQVLHRTKKDGFGKAYICGFKKLLKQDFTHILQMDADLSHNPKYITNFILQVEHKGADFVVGSRYINGGSTPDWSVERILLSRFGNLYARLFLGNKIHDYTGGYNLYSMGLLKTINLNSLKAEGYGFLIELKYKALKSAVNVQEIPIVFMDRQHGNSKLPKNTILKNIMLVPKIRFTNSG